VYNCECECLNSNSNNSSNNSSTENHVNAFIDLNGIPYVLAEYLDKDNFQQVDRSLIRSEIFVDQSEAMRAVVDINIDDIGKRASDGLPAIIGNNTKQKNLIKMISDNCIINNNQINVLRRGIIIRVDYQLENYRTGQVIRSMTESFRITNRNYFLDVNPREVNDNAIIVNFCNTLVSTINEFTHGHNPMIMRVTNVHMSYEMVKVAPKLPRIKQSMSPGNDYYYLPTNYGMEQDLYYYHKMMQNQHCMPGCNMYGHEPVSMISPSAWTMFNRFYHFDNDAHDIVIHGQEVNDPMTKVALVPCGTVRVNRTFKINPGHRIIFKFCIWKNDLTVVSDAAEIAKTLGIQVDSSDSSNNNDNSNGCNCNQNDNVIDLNYETMMNMLRQNMEMNNKQNCVINKLTNTVTELLEKVESIHPSDEETENPDQNQCGCDDCICKPDEPVDDEETLLDIPFITSDDISRIVSESSKEADDELAAGII